MIYGINISSEDDVSGYFLAGLIGQLQRLWEHFSPVGVTP